MLSRLPLRAITLMGHTGYIRDSNASLNQLCPPILKITCVSRTICYVIRCIIIFSDNYSISKPCASCHNIRPEKCVIRCFVRHYDTWFSIGSNRFCSASKSSSVDLCYIAICRLRIKFERVILR